VKVTCSAKGCARYRTQKLVEPGVRWVWICPAHWKRLTKAERRVWQRAMRRQRKFGREAFPSSVFWRIWRALARRCTEAGGEQSQGPLPAR
jgi:hypothetical protein